MYQKLWNNVPLYVYITTNGNYILSAVFSHAGVQKNSASSYDVEYSESEKWHLDLLRGLKEQHKPISIRLLSGKTKC